MLVVDLLKTVLGFAFIAMHLFNIFLLKKLRKKVVFGNVIPSPLYCLLSFLLPYFHSPWHTIL